jgi:hypothetical protein
MLGLGWSATRIGFKLNRRPSEEMISVMVEGDRSDR